MRILLFGGKGYMGRQILKAFPDAVSCDLDIADQAAVSKALDQHAPDSVINAAGKTGVPNVDWCEDHRAETLRSNVTGVSVLLEECGKRGVHLTHLSSGCIYAGDNGGRGFTEEDAPNFFGSFYSRTKAWSDQMCRDFEHFPNGGGVLTLRLRMPFDGTDAPRNLLTKLKNYTRVLDAENSLTCIPDFLTAAQHLITQRNTGIFNIVNEGTISPYRIMELYREIVDPAHHFERLIVQDLPGVTKAGRSNCVLSTVKLAAQGFALRPVEAAVREALEQIAGRS